MYRIRTRGQSKPDSDMKKRALGQSVLKKIEPPSGHKVGFKMSASIYLFTTVILNG